jgi:hypothetical protein
MLALLVAMLFAWANKDLKWGYFGEHGDLAYGIALFVVIIALNTISPGIRKEMTKIKEEKERRINAERNVGTNGIVLSRPMSSTTKWVFPILLVTGVLAIAFYTRPDTSDSGTAAQVAVSVICVGMFAYFFKRTVWTAVDEVIDFGVEIFVRKGSKTERISVLNISNIDEVTEKTLTTTILQFNAPCRFGKEIRFYAKLTLDVENAEPGSVCDRIVQLRKKRTANL